MGRRLIEGVNDLHTWCIDNGREDLLEEWDAEKNGQDITPLNCAYGTHKKMWWRCKIGHVWDATPGDRIRGNGCPYCSGRIAIAGETDLLTTNPELVKEWDYNKNDPLGIKPEDIKAGSTKRVWWICKKGHEWSVSVNSRTSLKTGCPYCSGRLCISGENDLATVYPELALEWNYKKNTYKPSEVAKGSGKKVWWICPKKHEYEAVIYDRANGNGCPFCSGKKVLQGYNDLATLYPELINDWDYSKNTVNPTEVTAGTHKKVWWLCKKCGYSWETGVYSRAKTNGSGCPKCGQEKQQQNHHNTLLQNRGSLYETHPEVIAEWDYSKNRIDPKDITSGSAMKIWWICKKGHSYCQKIYHKISGIGCPVCAREQSSSFPEQAVMYYIKKYFPDAINGDRNRISPYELDINIPSKNTAIEYDGMAWHQDAEKDNAKNRICIEAGISLIRIREEGCPDISGCTVYNCKPGDYVGLGEIIQAILSHLGCSIAIDNNIDVEADSVSILESFLIKEKENSIAIKYPDLLKEWNYTKNGKLDPVTVSYGTRKKVWWICKEGHEWQASVAGRRTNGCPYCSNQKVLTGYNDLSTAYPQILAEWDYEKNNKEGIDPAKITPKTGRFNAWWICPKGHSYRTAVYNRTHLGSGCPYCANQKVLPGYNDLSTTYPDIAKEWDYEKNGQRTPAETLPGTKDKVWWKCHKGHSYQTAVSNRTSQKSGCPICGGKQVLLGYNDLASQYPDLLKEWDYKKNSSKNIEPTSITSMSGKKVWWICTEGHEWEVAPSNRIKYKTGCPYCSNYKTLSGYNDLETLYPAVASEWDYTKNMKLTPQNVGAGSSIKVWWICLKGHSYESQINSRTKQGSGCPYCAKKQLLVGFNDLATLHPEIAREWDYEKNGDFKPTDCIGGLRKVWWLCPVGHSYEMDINSRTSAGHGCPICARKRRVRKT